MATSQTNSAKTYKAMNTRDTSARDNDEVRHGTVRKDTTKKILRNGWIETAECDGQYTDDYKRDEARNYGKGPRTADAILEACDRVDPSNCWVKEYEDGRQEITLWWGFQSYTVELDQDAVTFEF